MANWTVLAFALALFGAPPVAAQSIEQSVKAAFLSKFPRYVEWPGGLGAPPVEICMVGADPFGRLIDQATQSEPSAFTIRRHARAEQARGCDVAFLQGTSLQSTAQMVKALSGAPVLTVTDSRYGNAKGIIHFAVRSGKVGFHIDDAMAAQSRLSISSRLLQLAISVRQRRG